METLAYYAFWSGVISTVVAVSAGLLYAFLPRLAMRSAVTSAGTVQVPAIITEPAWLQAGSRSMAWVAVAVLTVYLGLRWAASGLPPLSNMWEYTVAFGWAMVIGSRLVDWRHRAWGLGLVLLAGALALFAIAEAAFPSRIASFSAPHLQHLQAKHLLAIHAGTMLVAFSAFGVAFAGAAILLIRRLVSVPQWVPSSRTLQQITDGSVLLGFPFYTLGLAVGSYWMHQLWGKYWDWDAKAASSLVTWVIFAGYLHARNLRGWREIRAPILVAAGFAALMLSYFGVNLW